MNNELVRCCITERDCNPDGVNTWLYNVKFRKLTIEAITLYGGPGFPPLQARESIILTLRGWEGIKFPLVDFLKSPIFPGVLMYELKPSMSCNYLDVFQIKKFDEDLYSNTPLNAFYLRCMAERYL